MHGGGKEQKCNKPYAEFETLLKPLWNRESQASSAASLLRARSPSELSNPHSENPDAFQRSPSGKPWGFWILVAQRRALE